MVVIELGEKVVKLRRVFRLKGTNHSRFEKLPEGLGLFYRRQQLQATADLVLVHVSCLPKHRLKG